MDAAKIRERVRLLHTQIIKLRSASAVFLRSTSHTIKDLYDHRERQERLYSILDELGELKKKLKLVG